MKSNKLYNQEVYLRFYKEWLNTLDGYDEFIEKLDIGLQLIDYTDYGEHNYIIIDKPKYMLAKIKYGI